MYFATVPVSGVHLFNYITNLHEVYVFLSGGNSEKGFKYIRQIMTDNHYNIMQLQAHNTGYATVSRLCINH